MNKQIMLDFDEQIKQNFYIGVAEGDYPYSAKVPYHYYASSAIRSLVYEINIVDTFSVLDKLCAENPVISKYIMLLKKFPDQAEKYLKATLIAAMPSYIRNFPTIYAENIQFKTKQIDKFRTLALKYINSKTNN